MKRSQPHSFERVRPDGRVIKTVGGPMPSGGYVMCFSDITAQAQAITALKRAQSELESRVQERTLDLRQANEALAAADGEKTRFLAAASHDLLQPIHAARLFSSALSRQVEGNGQGLLRKLDLSIQSADTLLRTLLDISKLDAGVVVPVSQRFAVRPLVQDLVETMMPLAHEKGLELTLVGADFAVMSDPGLLRSIVQNFLSNAIRYTKSGRILVALRRRGPDMRIDVIDTGPGIAAPDHIRIFKEFERLPTAEGGGIGLGLAIVNRTARILGVAISMSSRLGRGSRFSVAVPTCLLAIKPAHDSEVDYKVFEVTKSVRRFRVLVVEDDPANQDAMQVYLSGLGHTCVCFYNGEQALNYRGHFDCGLVDFNLGTGMDGLQLIDALRAAHPDSRFALTTAVPEIELKARMDGQDIAYFRKPLDPNQLENWLGEVASLEA